MLLMAQCRRLQFSNSSSVSSPNLIPAELRFLHRELHGIRHIGKALGILKASRHSMYPARLYMYFMV